MPGKSATSVASVSSQSEFYQQNIEWSAFFRSQLLSKLPLVGLGINPQNGQRSSFTQEPPCFHANSLCLPITVKSSLTSGFFQKFASAHHSSFVMPAWRLLLQKMTQLRNTYKPKNLPDWSRLCLLIKQATAKNLMLKSL